MKASPAALARFRDALLQWYDVHRRDLPWRRTRDPYAIWISEIMLQQTRVAAVAGHYARFLKTFPTVVALALAAEEEVLASWSGLGYYRRARMLHRAAKVVVSEHGGDIPSELNALRRMPGVGAYTSAAIGSIAHGLPVAAVDGNVERVLARLEGASEQRGAVKWQQLAQRNLHPSRPGDFNQAMMELGATVCTPRMPRCLECPVFKWCLTRGEHPVGPRARMRSVEVAYAVFTRGVEQGSEVLLVQRPLDASIMAGMWELPQLPRLPSGREPDLIIRHAITTTNYYVRLFCLDEQQARTLRSPRGRVKIKPREEWKLHDNLPRLALTGLARKALQRLGHYKLPTPPPP